LRAVTLGSEIDLGGIDLNEPNTLPVSERDRVAVNDVVDALDSGRRPARSRRRKEQENARTGKCPPMTLGRGRASGLLGQGRPGGAKWEQRVVFLDVSSSVLDHLDLCGHAGGGTWPMTPQAGGTSENV